MHFVNGAILLIGMAMRSDIDVSDFWCKNEECSDYSQKDRGDIHFKENKGKCQNAVERNEGGGPFLQTRRAMRVGAPQGEGAGGG